MKHLFSAALILLLFASCSGNKAEHVERAFYYWKSDTYSFNDREDSILSKNRVSKLYVKFFEVEKHDVMGLVPVSKTSFHIYHGYDSLHLVPTVYLRNEVFKNVNKEALDKLADNVSFLINKYRTDKFGRIKNVDEYQMDCDWTLGTKENYFYFLKKIKEKSGKIISCTLRLYPYKYPDKMGVPPVDKAMLMCYNLIDPLENKDKNSILDLDELKAYMNTDDMYPLHLDVALPVYSWMMVYQNNHFTNVLYTDTKEASEYLKEEKPLWYAVTKDTVVNEVYLRIGDKIKLEETNAAQLQEAINIIKKHVELNDTITVSLFHLDDQQLSRFSHEETSAFYTAFTK